MIDCRLAAPGTLRKDEISAKQKQLARKLENLLRVIFVPNSRLYASATLGYPYRLNLEELFQIAYNLRIDMSLKDAECKLTWPLPGERIDTEKMDLKGDIEGSSATVVHFALTPVISRRYRATSDKRALWRERIIAKACVYPRKPVADICKIIL